MKDLINIQHCRIFVFAFLITAGLLAISASGSAQGCDPDEIVNAPGVYRGQSRGSENGIAKTDLAQQQEITRKMSQMVRDNYQPKGMNISYGDAHFNPASNKPNGVNTGNHYNTHFFLKYFFCNHENKMEEVAETHSILEMRVNELDYPHSFFVKEHIDEEDPETDVFATIKHKPVWNEKGYWTMTDTVYSGRDITHFHYMVTKNRTLPFVYVTRKEYVEKLRIYYGKLLRRELSSIENSDEKDTEFGKSSIENYKSFYGNSIQNIDNFLNNESDEALNEPATVIGGGPSSEFVGFPEGRYANWLIKPNPDYYNPKAPKYTPHFIDVHFSIYEPQTACLNAKNDILNIIDFKALREIVDKGGIPASSAPASAKPAEDEADKQ